MVWVSDSLVSAKSAPVSAAKLFPSMLMTPLVTGLPEGLPDGVTAAFCR